MLVHLLLVIALTFTRSYATCTENLAQKKATLEAKASTEREEVLRWNELSQSAQGKFSAAKRELMALKADLRISQDEVLAASNRVHCAQNKLAELDQLSCQLKNKIDEEYQRKIGLERSINLRMSRKRKRNIRQATYPVRAGSPTNGVPGIQAAANPSAPKEGDVRLTPDLDLSKLSDIALLRKSLDPIYRQTIDSLAWQSLADSPRKEVAAKPRQAAANGPPNAQVHGVDDKTERLAAARSGACDQKEQDEAAAFRKVKMEIFQDEAMLRNANDQLQSAQTQLSAEQNRLDEISRRICATRYDLKEAERATKEKLEALQQAQNQAAAHQDILTSITKQLQAVVAEMTHREMAELSSHNPGADQHPAERTARA